MNKNVLSSDGVRKQILCFDIFVKRHHTTNSLLAAVKESKQPLPLGQIPFYQQTSSLVLDQAVCSQPRLHLYLCPTWCMADWQGSPGGIQTSCQASWQVGQAPCNDRTIHHCYKLCIIQYEGWNPGWYEYRRCGIGGLFPFFRSKNMRFPVFRSFLTNFPELFYSCLAFSSFHSFKN